MSYTLPFKQGQTVCELGGGETPLRIDGFNITNVDVRKLPEVDIVQNLEEDFSNIGRWDGVYAQYIAEHISWRKVKTFFQSCYNILNPHGVAVFIVPNTLEQVIHLAQKPDWKLEDSCLLFGDQDYSDNTHKWALSPQLMGEILKESGFDKVRIIDHPNKESFDMIVEAYKGEEKKVEYEVDYFNGGVYLGSYRDFPVHQKTVEEILKRQPASVIDIGGARGYISKHLRYHDVPSTCLEVSKHCYHTRATEDFILHDATVTPYPVEDKEYDLAFSCAFLEHIPQDKVDAVILESIRISRRGLHGITFTITPEDIDHTHRSGTIKPREWWIQKFRELNPDYPVEIVDKEDLEKPPITIPQQDNGLVKLNIGSFTEMFYYNWVNIDKEPLDEWAKNHGYKFQQHDIRKPLPIQDNSVDYIVCHHTIEHVTREEGINFLKECYRILKPNGVIRLSYPCLFTLAEKYLNGNFDNYKYLSPEVRDAQDDSDAFWKLLTNGHLTAYDDTALVNIMNKMGFKADLSYFDSSNYPVIRNETVDSCPTVSSYVEAVKPKLPYENISSTATVKPDDALLRYLHG